MTIEFDGQNNKITRDTAGSIKVDRKTSDGDIVELQKDGSTVGSIGSIGGSFLFTDSPTANFFRINGTNEVAIASTKMYSPTDGRTDLGSSSERFKNLYLSGNIYLGGTGSANALDDYEEGEYQPTISVPSGSITLNTSFDTLRYTKIGRMVNVSGQIRVSSVSSPSGTPVTVSLPFANNDGSELSERTAGVFQIYALGTINTSVVIHIVGSDSSFRLQKLVSGTHVNIDGNEFSGDEELEFNLTYFTNS